MDAFLEAMLAFPTVIYTVMAGVCLLYWLFVIVGAADIDMLDSLTGKVEGAVKGAVEGTADAAAGAVKGAFEGAAKGAVEGVAGALKGGAEATLKGAADAATSTTGAAEFLAFLKLDKVPVTISASFFALFSWFYSMALSHWLPSDGIWGGALVGTGVLVGAAAAGIATTSLAVRPFASIFDEGKRTGGSTLIGKSCTIRSGKVDARSGQAEVDDGGAGLVIDVRTTTEGGLKKNDEAVIVEYDADSDCYVVEPMPSLIDAGSAREGLVSHPVPTLAERDAADAHAGREAVRAQAEPDKKPDTKKVDA